MSRQNSPTAHKNNWLRNLGQAQRAVFAWTWHRFRAGPTIYRSVRRSQPPQGSFPRSAPGRTRTCDILLRRQMLYPAELRAHRSQELLPARVTARATGRAKRANLTGPDSKRRRLSGDRWGGRRYIGRMADLTTHKSTPACPMTGPHDVRICGLAAARRERSADMNAAIERQIKEEQDRAARRGAS